MKSIQIIIQEMLVFFFIYVVRLIPMLVPGTKPGGSFKKEVDGGVVVGKFDNDGSLSIGVNC